VSMAGSSPAHAPEAAAAEATAAVIDARAVSRRYGAGETAVEALSGVTVEIRAGRLTAVMGPSGSGKSTLMHILAGLDRPTSGTVALAGEPITSIGDAALTQLRRRHVGFVFQFFNLLPMLTAAENIVLPLSLAGRRLDDGWFAELTERVGLRERLRHRPGELSGGEQQRVAIARAVIGRPTVVFADEPTGNLDTRSSGEILELLRDLCRSYGQTIVMVTHDPRAASIADRILFLCDGAVALDRPGGDAAGILKTMDALVPTPA
jgi:putative ABC transport system ATP-binding protein